MKHSTLLQSNQISRRNLYWGAVLIFVLGFSSFGADANMKLNNRIKIKKRSYFSKQKSDETTKQYNAAKFKLLQKKRLNLIFDIKRFLREATDKAQRIELNFRLGALYMEDYYARLAKAQALFNLQYKKYDALKKANPKSKRRPPKLNNNEAMVSLDKAQKIYKDLAKRFPTHSRSDELLYMLAASSLDQSDIKGAMVYFERLAQKYPKSKFTHDAHVELADYYFNSHNYQKADFYYSKIIKGKDTSLLTYSRYKKAWCAYNLERKVEALNLFKWVVTHEDDDNVEDPASLVRIKNEALNDIIHPYADLNKHKEAIRFFRARGQDKLRNAMKAMASIYFEAGKYENSRYLWERLLKLNRNHKENPSYEISIIQSYEKQAKVAQSVKRLFDKLPQYLKNSQWHEVNSAKPKVVNEAKKSFEEVARKYAFKYHSEAQKTKKSSLYKFALNLYSQYLKYFPYTSEASKIRFYMAEILFKEKRFVAAADQYYEVYKDRRAGKLRKDSIRFALTSLGKALNIERKKKGLQAISTQSTSKIKQSKSQKKIPYSKVEGKLIEVATVYLRAYAKSKEAPEVLYERSYLLYAHHDFLKAYKGFWSFIKQYPTHPSVHSAGNLVLDILNRKNNYKLLASACKNFMRNPAFIKKRAFIAEVADVLRHTELKLIAQIEKKKQYKKAADAYIEYTKGYGTQDESLYEKALYNAAINYEKAGMFTKGVLTQEKFLRRFPNSPLRENMMLAVAKSYERLANFSKAAEYFETFARQYSRNKQAQTTERLAGLYYWGGGNSAKAEQLMLRFIASNRSANLKKLVKQDLIDLYTTLGADDKLINLYYRERAQAKMTDFITYSVKIAELKYRRNHRDTSSFISKVLAVANRHQGEVKSSIQGREALSKLLFWSAQNKEKSFYRIKLSLPESTLERRLQTKLSLIKGIERDYTLISKLNTGDWGLGGMYKTAMAYNHLAVSVQQSPIPSNLSGKEVEVYRSELDKSLVAPFKERAQKLAVQCVDKAQDLNLLSSWSSRCYALAGRLQPKRYPVVRTFYLPANRTALILPNKKSKIKRGDVEKYSLPLYSSKLFSKIPLRRIASVSPFYADKQSEPLSISDGPNAVPMPTNYRVLSTRRINQLKGEIKSEKPKSRSQKPTFSYLNLLKSTQPKKAIPLIKVALENDPGSFALLNLLALAHLEYGNLGEAKVTWLSMRAQGAAHPEILNNLGVISNLKGDEDQAIAYFQQALKMGDRQSAPTNLGFIALKYHNGFEAKRYFEKALAKSKRDETLRIGRAIAKLQNLELEEAKKLIPRLITKYSGNPYAYLSVAYFLMDFEKKHNSASKVLSKYMGRNAAGKDLQFRKALSEAKQGAIADKLPTID